MQPKDTYGLSLSPAGATGGGKMCQLSAQLSSGKLRRRDAVWGWQARSGGSSALATRPRA